MKKVVTTLMTMICIIVLQSCADAMCPYFVGMLMLVIILSVGTGYKSYLDDQENLRWPMGSMKLIFIIIMVNFNYLYLPKRPN